MTEQESDRTAASIVSTTLKDVGIVTEEDYTNVINKNKIHREQRKERKNILKMIRMKINVSANILTVKKIEQLFRKKSLVKSRNKFQLKNILHYCQNLNLSILDMLLHHQVIVVILQKRF